MQSSDRGTLPYLASFPAIANALFTASSTGRELVKAKRPRKVDDGAGGQDNDGDDDDHDEDDVHPAEASAALQVTIADDSGSYGPYSEVMGVNPDVQSHVPVSNSYSTCVVRCCHVGILALGRNTVCTLLHVL